MHKNFHYKIETRSRTSFGTYIWPSFRAAPRTLHKVSTIRWTFSSVRNTEVVSSMSEFEVFFLVSFRPRARLVSSLIAPAPKPAARLPKLIKRLTRLEGTCLSLENRLNFSQTITIRFFLTFLILALNYFMLKLMGFLKIQWLSLFCWIVGKISMRGKVRSCKKMSMRGRQMNASFVDKKVW